MCRYLFKRLMNDANNLFVHLVRTIGAAVIVIKQLYSLSFSDRYKFQVKEIRITREHQDRQVNSNPRSEGS